jgi:hypothetical protein
MSARSPKKKIKPLNGFLFVFLVVSLVFARLSRFSIFVVENRSPNPQQLSNKAEQSVLLSEAANELRSGFDFRHKQMHR